MHVTVIRVDARRLHDRFKADAESGFVTWAGVGGGGVTCSTTGR